jgi:hypothetical protein
MTTKTFNEDTWIICHGPDHIHVVAATAGDTVGTGQPNIEEFETLAECYDFARALGWVEPPCQPLPESEWPEGFVPNLDEDGMQLCHDTEPLWVPKPRDSVELPEFADLTDINASDTVINVSSKVVAPAETELIDDAESDE